MTDDASTYKLWLLEAAISIIVILFSILLHWPTVLTISMFLALVFIYIHLAHSEEAEARLQFGDAYVRYMARVPGWFPHLDSRKTQSGTA